MKSVSWIKTITACLLSAFFIISSGYSLATLPASQNPSAKRRIISVLEKIRDNDNSSAGTGSESKSPIGSDIKWFDDKAALDFACRSLRATYGRYGLDKQDIDKITAALTCLPEREGDITQALSNVITELKDIMASENFRRMYSIYKSGNKPRHIFGLIKAPIEKQASKNDRGLVIADIGCGNNALAGEIVSGVNGIDKVIGTDIYEAKDIMTGPGKIEFRKQSDGITLPIDTGTVDAAITVGMFHYLTDTDLDRFLSEVKRILKPDGMFILLDDMYTESGSENVVFNDEELIPIFTSLSDVSKVNAMSIIEYMGGTIVPSLNAGIPPDKTTEAVLSGQYTFRTTEKLRTIIQEAGFSVTSDAFLGFPEGRLHLNPHGIILAQPAEEESATRAASYDAGSASVLLSELLNYRFNEDLIYEIKYDTSKLSISQIGIIEAYIKLMKKNMRNPDNIKVRPFSGNKGSKESLLAVYCTGAEFKGECHMDVEIPEGNLHDYMLRIPGMINIALASSSIPGNATEEELRTAYSPIIGFIKNQYRELLGVGFVIPENAAEALKALKHIVLTLPSIYRMPHNRIEEYNRLAKKALVSA